MLRKLRNRLHRCTGARDDCVTAANIDLAHVRDIEKAGVGSSAQVFFDCSGGILHGHIPTAEVDHAGTQLPVGAIEWSLF